MKRLMWNCSDGSCSTTVFPNNFEKMAQERGMTPTELKTETLVKLMSVRPDLAGLVPVEVEENELDDPRLFGRAAWGHGGKTDMTRAQVIHMNRIREVRNAKLVVADIDLKKAEDAGDATGVTAIRTRRQVLRDIPQTFDITGATTPEELDVLWPSDLPKPTGD